MGAEMTVTADPLPLAAARPSATTGAPALPSAPVAPTVAPAGLSLAPALPTAPAVLALAESRPAAVRWQSPLLAAEPAQPTLDLRPPEEPAPVVAAADLAVRAAAGLPDAREWSVALATLLLEVLAARRPVGQLTRWLGEDVLSRLAEALPHRRSLPPGGSRPARLQSVRLQYPSTGVAEVSVHARSGPASLALALRLEARRSRWLCTALELPPRQLPAAPDPTQ